MISSVESSKNYIYELPQKYIISQSILNDLNDNLISDNNFEYKSDVNIFFTKSEIQEMIKLL